MTRHLHLIDAPSPVSTKGPRLVVYRQELLAYSETFILRQAQAMRTLRPVLLGLRRIDGLRLTVPSQAVFDDRSVSARYAAARFKGRRRHPRVRQMLEQLEPAGVLAHFAQDGLRIARSAQDSGLPLAVFVHGSDVLLTDESLRRTGLAGFQLTRGWRELAEAAEVFFAPSDFVATRLCDHGVSSSKIRTHYIGVPVGPPPADPTGRDVLFVGRLVPNKGVRHLVSAAAQLRTPGVRVRIVGDGPELGTLVAQARRLGVLGRVSFEGVLRPEQVREAIERARVVCVPSVSTPNGAAEGFGLTALEAQERGRPVVAFATGGLVEAVQDGVTGVLVPPGDERLLAHALDDLLSDDDQSASMGLAGRRRAVREFDVMRRTAALEQQLLTSLRCAPREPSLSGSVVVALRPVPEA